MNRLLMFIALASTLAGCTTLRETFNLDEQTAGKTIDCSGTGLTWGTCFAKADSFCGTSGYDVLSKTGDPGSAPGDQTGLFGSATMNRSMVIKCKAGPAAIMPTPAEMVE